MDQTTTSIIIAIIAAVPSLIATLVSNHNAKIKSDENRSLTIYRIDQLEQKVDKHNQVAERTFKLEEDVKNIKEDINEIKKKF